MPPAAPNPATANLPEFSVSELSFALKRVVEDNFEFVRVRGEVSGWKKHSSGHCYFALKDEGAALDAVCWRMNAQRLKFKPEDGLEVVCVGKLSTYPGRSKYQLLVERMEPAGVGALMALLEERKRRLQAEGLFAPERKRAIPYLPEVVGVVTSPTGAVIRDILHRLADRFPRRVLLWPVAVQGEGAAAQVAAAIRGFNAIAAGGPIPRPDLIIVARGGGSIEDLWAFNEEEVVRAAAASEIPLISAVGHETDTTLIDYASDRRAPTPSAAAEMAVPVRGELLATLADLDRRKQGAMRRLLDERRRRVGDLARGLRHPRDLLQLAAQRLDETGERLRRGLLQAVETRRARLGVVEAKLRPALLRRDLADAQRGLGEAGRRLDRSAELIRRDAARRLEAQGKLLESYSYHSVLERGFAVVRGQDGRPIPRAAGVAPGAALTLEFHDGAREAQAEGGTAKPRAGRKPGGQGTLF